VRPPERTPGAPRGADELLALARHEGATGAALIPSRELVVRDDLAALCAEPRCPNYGTAASCPPHVAGPAGFRELVRCHPLALVYKIDVPAEVLLSPEVVELMRLVHGIGTAVERRASELGYAGARAFGGGSCKQLFCGEEPDCRVVAHGGDCRFPDQARPSLSGFGVDTTAMLRAAGWTLRRVDPGAASDADATGTVCGLVLFE
jgi:predicted metal-binding protein